MCALFGQIKDLILSTCTVKRRRFIFFLKGLSCGSHFLQPPLPESLSECKYFIIGASNNLYITAIVLTQSAQTLVAVDYTF